jgi:hypothetical protein
MCNENNNYQDPSENSRHDDGQSVRIKLFLVPNLENVTKNSVAKPFHAKLENNLRKEFNNKTHRACALGWRPFYLFDQRVVNQFSFEFAPIYLVNILYLHRAD